MKDLLNNLGIITRRLIAPIKKSTKSTKKSIFHDISTNGKTKNTLLVCTCITHHVGCISSLSGLLDYDTLPRWFISSRSVGRTLRRRRCSKTGFRVLSHVWMSHLLISPADELSRRASIIAAKRPFDKREINLSNQMQLNIYVCRLLSATLLHAIRKAREQKFVNALFVNHYHKKMCN